MSCYDLRMPTQSIRAIESIQIAIMNKILYISVPWLLSLKLDVAEKGTLGEEKFCVELVALCQQGKVKLDVAEKGTLGAEKSRVELVALFHRGKGKRRDGLVGNRGNGEPVAPVVLSTIVNVMVVVPTQALLVMLFVIFLFCRWNNASENPTSTKKYKDLIAEDVIFICNTGTALLICVS
jgi:hypothetical protein